MILITAAVPDVVSLLELFIPPGTRCAAVDLTNAFFLHTHPWGPPKAVFSEPARPAVHLAVLYLRGLSTFLPYIIISIYRDLDCHSLPHCLELVQESQWYSSSHYWYLLTVNINTAKYAASVYLSYSSQQPLRGREVEFRLCHMLTQDFKYDSRDLQYEWPLIQVCSTVMRTVITIYRKGNWGMNKWSNLPEDTQLGGRA